MTRVALETKELCLKKMFYFDFGFKERFICQSGKIFLVLLFADTVEHASAAIATKKTPNYTRQQNAMRVLI